MSKTYDGNADLLQDLDLLDLYAEGDAVAITVDEWGNEWESSDLADTDYRIVDD